MDINPRTENEYFGKVRYNDMGLPVCHICGAAHAKLMNHVYQVHSISARDYKIMFGLDIRKGIIAQSTRDKLRKALDENYDKAVDNLLKHGSRYRFKKGVERPRDMYSEQSRVRQAEINKAMGEIRLVRNVSKQIVEKMKSERDE